MMSFNVSPNTLINLFRRYRLVSHRYIYTLYWCAICQHRGHTNIGIKERDNKDQYKRHKKYFPYLVFGLQKDAITGWVFMASYFFSIDNYNICLKLIEYVWYKYRHGHVEETADIESHIGKINNLESEALKYGVLNAHEICRRHYVDLYGFILIYLDSPLKLKLDILENLCVIRSPLVYMNFMRFMCYYYLRDSSGVQYSLRALSDLHRVDVNSYFDIIYCLGLAHYTLKEYATALSLFMTISDVLKDIDTDKKRLYADLDFKLDLVINKLKTALS
ncbi:unnamed protein product [Mytilus edulis]|uniref:Uncharacterized protein n=1 Tax=Mytilus edulis TaxID=6550 RepID=A0A8S3TWC1_MYTED|nr:unnamed protein product [Mytilus edulis]